MIYLSYGTNTDRLMTELFEDLVKGFAEHLLDNALRMPE
jgi:hypothetical protein